MLRLLESIKLPNAEGVFETLPIKNGRLEFFADHWKRFNASCRDLRYPLLSDPNEIENEIVRLNRNCGAKDQVVRFIALKNEMPVLFLQLLPFPKPLTKITLIPVHRPAHPLARHKITLRRSYESLKRKAVDEDAFDALLFSPENHLLETSRANVFAVINGRLSTPPDDGRILPGIMRRKVIDAACNLSIPVEEKIIVSNELQAAEEIFITNSLRGVLPVAQIRNVWVKTSKDNPIAAALMNKL